LFQNHLKASFQVTSPIPKVSNELNERIILLSALLETTSDKGLEYYLARLYQVRGYQGDLQKALFYVERSTVQKGGSWADAWVLRIRLEGLLNGPERALRVCREGIGRIPADKNLFTLYLSCVELLAKAGKDDDAILLLKDGIALIPADKGL